MVKNINATSTSRRCTASRKSCNHKIGIIIAPYDCVLRTGEINTCKAIKH